MTEASLNTVELVEYALPLKCRDARSAISNAHHQLRLIDVGRDLHRRPGRSMAYDILDKVGHHLINLHRVERNRGEISRDVRLHYALLHERLHTIEHIID